MLFTLFAADQSIGRVDTNCLPDQSLMELAISKATDEAKAHYTDAHGDYTDACEWDFVTCDADGHVEDIYISFRSAMTGGTFCFDFLPRRISTFAAHLRSFQGTIETAQLPETLEDFNVLCNKLEGTVDMTRLPNNLIKFGIISNRFTGSLDLTLLPPLLDHCAVDRNKFSGTVNLSALPPKLRDLTFSHNDLTGAIVLVNLPETLARIDVNDNDFSSGLEILQAPQKFRLNAYRAGMKGTVVVHSSLVSEKIRLYENSIEKVVDENGSPHAQGEKMCIVLSIDRAYN